MLYWEIDSLIFYLITGNIKLSCIHGQCLQSEPADFSGKLKKGVVNILQINTWWTSVHVMYVDSS